MDQGPIFLKPWALLAASSDRWVVGAVLYPAPSEPVLLSDIHPTALKAHGAQV